MGNDGRRFFHVTWGSAVYDPNAPRVHRSRWCRFKDEARWRMGCAIADLGSDLYVIGDWFQELGSRVMRLGGRVSWGDE